MNFSSIGWLTAPKDVSVDRLVRKIEESQCGFSSTLQGGVHIEATVVNCKTAGRLS